MMHTMNADIACADVFPDPMNALGFRAGLMAVC